NARRPEPFMDCEGVKRIVPLSPRSHGPRGNAVPDAPASSSEQPGRAPRRRRASKTAFPRGPWERGERSGASSPRRRTRPLLPPRDDQLGLVAGWLIPCARAGGPEGPSGAGGGASGGPEVGLGGGDSQAAGG